MESKDGRLDVDRDTSVGRSDGLTSSRYRENRPTDGASFPVGTIVDNDSGTDFSPDGSGKRPRAAASRVIGDEGARRHRWRSPDELQS